MIFNRMINYLIFVVIITSCNFAGKTKTQEKVVNNTKDSSSIDNKIEPEGTQLLESRRINLIHEITDYYVNKIIFNECKKSSNPNPKSHHMYQNINKTDSCLIVEFSFISVCDSDFLCDAEYIVDDKRLNLIYIQFNSNVTCNCVYNLGFQLKKKDTRYDSKFDIELLSINNEDIIEIGH